MRLLHVSRAGPRLVLLSFLMLFLELALIRWLGSNILHLSYFSNFVLLGSFLGIGVGFLMSDSERDLFRLLPRSLALFMAFVLVFPVEIERGTTQLLFFANPERTGLPMWVMLPVVFLAVAALLAMVGQEVARAFRVFKPLVAYRLDIAGALAGVVSFAALSFVNAPPLAWGVIVVGLIAVLVPQADRAQLGFCIAVLVLLSIETMRPLHFWSPYYKIRVFPEEGYYGFTANGIPHQAIKSNEERQRSEPLYYEPYRDAPENAKEDILIIGAGTGSDVAIALEQGAQHVDAVEIDPVLHELGKTLHPSRPYDDPRVVSRIEDGRAFLERTNKLYDLVLFGLPDSLTLVSGQSALRLESYLFTREAIAEVRAHLKSDGVFSMYNHYRETWLIDRFAETLEYVFGHLPCVAMDRTTGRFAVLTIGVDPDDVACAPRLSVAAVASPVSDDYPFPYLREPSIPWFYAVTLLLILLCSVALVRSAGAGLRGVLPYADLFFMGAAFLLLETKSVTQFALLFGTTWFVNALVFAAILVAVLLAIEVAQRVVVSFRVLYVLLGLSLALAWAVPYESLLDLAFAPRLIAASAMAFAPVLLANIVFAQRFAAVSRSTDAFAANLLGAMFGGVLEYLALITGYRALLLAVAILYALAFLLGRRRLVGAEVREVALVAAR